MTPGEKIAAEHFSRPLSRQELARRIDAALADAQDDLANLRESFATVNAAARRKARVMRNTAQGLGLFADRMAELAPLVILALRVLESGLNEEGEV